MKTLQVTGVLAFLLAGLAAEGAAQTVLDVPTLSLVDRGMYRITIQIEAGFTGAPAGFAVDWMLKSDYDIYDWDYAGYVEFCSFHGAPTLNGIPTSGSFSLGPGETAQVQLGDLFDETGTLATYSDGLPPGTEFVVRVHARGNAQNLESADSPSFFVSTTSAECTQGFWKTHPEDWPLGCLPMTLGTVSYTQAQLLAIYNTPARGNGLVFLAHQLITAKLNACNGSNLSNVSATVTAADALIGNQVVPTVGSGYLAPNLCTGPTETLDQFNNGLILGVANCPTPVRASAWSAVKALYR